jgi:hypothetical protein
VRKLSWRTLLLLEDKKGTEDKKGEDKKGTGHIGEEEDWGRDMGY